MGKRVVAVGRVSGGSVMLDQIAADFGGDSAAADALAHYGAVLEEARKDPRRSVYGADVDLHDVMEFEHVIAVYQDGTVTDAPANLYAPECYWNGFGDGQHIESGTGWELLNGFSGQHGYSGPIMHASEYIGAGLADYIREHPGYYVSVVCDVLDEPDSPAGWTIAYRPLPEV